MNTTELKNQLTESHESSLPIIGRDRKPLLYVFSRWDVVALHPWDGAGKTSFPKFILLDYTFCVSKIYATRFTHYLCFSLFPFFSLACVTATGRLSVCCIFCNSERNSPRFRLIPIFQQWCTIWQSYTAAWGARHGRRSCQHSSFYYPLCVFSRFVTIIQIAVPADTVTA